MNTVDTVLLRNLFLSQDIASEREVLAWARMLGLNIRISYPDGTVNSESGILVDLSNNTFDGWEQEGSCLREYFSDPKKSKRFKVSPATEDEIPELFPLTRYEVKEEDDGTSRVAVFDNLLGHVIIWFLTSTSAQEWLNEQRPANSDINRYWDEDGLKVV